MMNDPYCDEETVPKSDYDSLMDMYDSERDRADEAERLLSEMAHAFKARDSASYAAFVISEPSVIDHAGVVS